MRRWLVSGGQIWVRGVRECMPTLVQFTYPTSSSLSYLPFIPRYHPTHGISTPIYTNTTQISNYLTPRFNNHRSKEQKKRWKTQLKLQWHSPAWSDMLLPNSPTVEPSPSPENSTSPTPASTAWQNPPLLAWSPPESNPATPSPSSSPTPSRFVSPY